MSVYKLLLNLKNKGQLNLIVIVAPPRTGSTMLQAVISKSRSVNAGINDPQSQEKCYQQIHKEVLKSSINKKNSTILLKEMSHWIESNNEYKKLFTLADKIIVSIRNPLLSTESRIRKFIESLTLKPMPRVYQWLVEDLKIKHGFTQVNLIKQKRLLNLFAETMDFEDWQVMIKELGREQNYRYFDGILKSDNTPTGFSVEQLGWNEINKYVEYLEKNGKLPIIVDCTDLRLAPEAVTKGICKKLNIRYGREMIQGWKSKDFSSLITEDTIENRNVQSLWYDSISQSEGIKLPTEKSPDLASFPKDIQNYLRFIAIPIYVSQYKSKYRVRVEGKASDETKKIKENKLKDLDPLFSTLVKHTELPTRSLLKQIFLLIDRKDSNAINENQF